MRADYLDMMAAHVDEGGTLSHRNGVELLAEVKGLRAKIAEARGCFAAAEVEGLSAAIRDTGDDRLRDLLNRRVMHADAALEATGVEPTHGT